MENIIRNNNEFVVVDIETSHFHPKKGAMIIELAAVKIKNDKIIDKRTQLINPERKITKKITEITGITNEMLIGKPVFREVLPNFYKFLGNAVIVAHNAHFDWDRFLIYFLEKVGIYPQNQVVDTLALSRKYIKSEKYKLGTLCETLNIEHNNKHRALGDTLATAELFLYLKKNYIKENYSKQISLVNNKEKNNHNSQKVRKVAYWQKNIKNEKLKRIYVTLDRSVVFYDIPTKAWEVKSSNEPINFDDIENKVIKHLNANDMEDVIAYYN